MARQPSPETQLRNAKSQIVNLMRDLSEAKRIAEGYRVRASKAEAEVSEWKARFDALLRRDEAIERLSRNGKQ